MKYLISVAVVFMVAISLTAAPCAECDMAKPPQSAVQPAAFTVVVRQMTVAERWRDNRLARLSMAQAQSFSRPVVFRPVAFGGGTCSSGGCK